ncbi:MAG: anhydro-N-acetylmuramic acid kinase [Proteobacteria bacterium]|nr:anhydro-N-acetylmuramic acid kinase [Pseudomonadota bacterium]
MGDLYIGLMSGTSMDGIDAALVDIGETSIEIVHTRDQPYPGELRDDLLAAIGVPLDEELPHLADLERRTGECFRDAALALLKDAGISSNAVTAIGSHGQTVRHQPNAERPFTLQIGDPAIIATGTGITTVADFRSADIAVGGQGAPLAPVFHEWLFRTPGVYRAILNIGGIANLTLLSPGHATVGFDTGPGNTLMDAWTRKHHAAPYDRNGDWANSGTPNATLLRRFLEDDYFATAPPKSTGFEHFNLHWIAAANVAEVAAVDVQATLCALTAQTISDALRRFAPRTSEVLVCGGGVHNAELMRQIGWRLAATTVASTATAGLHPDWVEAVAFAWLAMRRMQNLPGNLPSVTGAREAVTLGSIHRPA